MTASKDKGTGGERELQRLLESMMPHRIWRRTAPTSSWDIETADSFPGQTGHIIRVLATRPDRGEWLLSTPLAAFALGDVNVDPIWVEVKRHKAFAHHSIFNEKFGRLA